MATIRYPFLYFRPNLKLRPYLQIRVTNPASGQSECHTCAIDIFDFRGRHFFTVKAAPVQVLPKLGQTLIGVDGCLEFLKLRVDYPQAEFYLTR